MNTKEFWRRIFGFKKGDKVRIVNPNSSAFGLRGTILSVMRMRRFILYEVEVELLSKDGTTHLLWALFRAEDLEWIVDE